MKYILIISAFFIASCGQSKEEQQQAQTEQIQKNITESNKVLLPLMQERDRKIRELVSQGKEQEASLVGKDFIRKRDSIMRINY